MVYNFQNLFRAVRPVLPANADSWVRERLTGWEDFPPPDDGAWVKMYEHDVRVTLNALRDTEIGRCLLKSLNPKHALWLVPWRRDVCNAQTTYRSSDWERGVEIRYSPEIYDSHGCGRMPGYRRDESLFHELVHASRQTRLSFDELSHDPLEQMDNREEFLAVMLSNSYRSERGARKFNFDYLSDRLGSQIEVEQFLSSKRDYIEAIKYFLDDPLIKTVLNLPMPFNIFRDFRRLEAAYQNSATAHMDHLRDQFNPFSNLIHTE